MKLKALVLTAAMAIATNAYAADENKQKATNKGDSQAMGWLIVVNKSEIEAAKAAKNKKLNEDVTEYADLMIDEHSKNLDQTLEVSKKIEIEPLQDQKAAMLEKNSKRVLTNMEKLDDNKFQKAYVDAMIKDHSTALKTLDKEYLPKVNNEELKEHLTKTRAHIAEHLDKAKKLKANEKEQHN